MLVANLLAEANYTRMNTRTNTHTLTEIPTQTHFNKVLRLQRALFVESNDLSHPKVFYSNGSSFNLIKSHVGIENHLSSKVPQESHPKCQNVDRETTIVCWKTKRFSTLYETVGECYCDRSIWIVCVCVRISVVLVAIPFIVSLCDSSTQFIISAKRSDRWYKWSSTLIWHQPYTQAHKTFRKILRHKGKAQSTRMR